MLIKPFYMIIYYPWCLHIYNTKRILRLVRKTETKLLLKRKYAVKHNFVIEEDCREIQGETAFPGNVKAAFILINPDKKAH